MSSPQNVMSITGTLASMQNAPIVRKKIIAKSCLITNTTCHMIALCVMHLVEDTKYNFNL